jgi:hypothetical protein
MIERKDITLVIAKRYGRRINPLSAELNPICHLLALLGDHPILHISGVRVKDVAETTLFVSLIFL